MEKFSDEIQEPPNSNCDFSGIPHILFLHFTGIPQNVVPRTLFGSFALALAGGAGRICSTANQSVCGFSGSSSVLGSEAELDGGEDWVSGHLLRVCAHYALRNFLTQEGEELGPVNWHLPVFIEEIHRIFCEKMGSVLIYV